MCVLFVLRANANETGIEETRGSREHVRPGDHHGLDGIWFVPDHGRLHGGVRVRRAGWAVGEFGWTVVVFNGRSSRERLRRCRRDARDWRGYSGVFALVDLSRRRGVPGAFQGLPRLQKNGQISRPHVFPGPSKVFPI